MISTKIVKDVLEIEKVVILARKFLNTKWNWKKIKIPKSQKSKTLNFEKKKLNQVRREEEKERNPRGGG